MNITKYIDDNLIIEFYNYNKTDNINVQLELVRCDFYNIIVELFIKTTIKYIGFDIFNKKKPYKRSLANIFSNFIFSQYRKNNNSEDIFIPKINEINFIENVLMDYLKINKLNNIDLTDFSKDFLQIYKKQYKKFIIEKKKCIHFTNQFKMIKVKSKLFYIKNSKFIKLFPNKIYNKKYQVIIYKERFQYLKNIYIKNGGKENFIEVLYCILLRYFTLGSNNNQLAVSPSTMKQFKDEYKMSFESFASAINFNSNYFCSLYPDLESIFGSFGNFFEVEFIKGCFNFNPPFQEDIINLGIEKIFHNLENSKEDLTFIITIPVWDTIGKKSFGIEDKYADLPIINKIRESKFLEKIEPIDKKNFDYHDYIFNLVKNVTIQNTYVIILSNKKKLKINI